MSQTSLEQVSSVVTCNCVEFFESQWLITSPFVQVFNQFASEQESQDGVSRCWAGGNLGESPEEAGISASASITAAAVSVDDIDASIIPQLLSESADPGCAADGAVVATSTSQ